jgi:hypothetical protein
VLEWQQLLDAAVTDDDSSLLPAKQFPTFTAFKATAFNVRQSLLGYKKALKIAEEFERGGDDQANT